MDALKSGVRWGTTITRALSLRIAMSYTTVLKTPARVIISSSFSLEQRGTYAVAMLALL